MQLLHKMRIRSAEGSETLLKVIRNPVTVHLPVGARIMGASCVHGLQQRCFVHCNDESVASWRGCALSLLFTCIASFPVSAHPCVTLKRSCCSYTSLLLLFVTRYRHFRSSRRRCRCPAGTSKLGKMIDPFELVAGLPEDRPVVFVFGAMAKGAVKADYVEETYSFSQYPVSRPLRQRLLLCV